MSTELIKIEEKNTLAVFSENGGLDGIIKQVEMEIASFEHDLSTGAGRDRTRSLANKVAKTKTYLDGLGKDLVSDWKAKAKTVDQNRKLMRDQLDALKLKARAPLTEWETEQKRIEEEKRIAEEQAALKAEIESCHEIALLINEKFDFEKEQARIAQEKAEQERIAREAKEQAEREARIAREAKEKAEREAKEREEALIREAKEREEKGERERLAAIEREKQLEREKIAAQERAKAQAEQAEKQRLADIEAAKQAEIQRQKDEAERIERERLQAEANKAHAAQIHNEMMQAAIDGGVNPEQAKAFVILLAKCKIPHISAIKY